MHNFEESNKRGARGEARVARHLEANGFCVERAVTSEEQFAGVDFYATRLATGERRSIEVKTDFKGQHTGNAAIETVSNDRTGRAGWALTCSADWLVYLVEGLDVLYWLRPEDVRASLPAWQRDYPAYAAPNPGYRTLGVLVPLREFEMLAVSVVSL